MGLQEYIWQAKIDTVGNIIWQKELQRFIKVFLEVI
jgi:hypothetical protein